MIKQLVSFTLIGIIFLVPVVNPLFAQTAKLSKEEKKIAKVKAKLAKLGTGEKAKIKVELTTGGKHQGYVSELGEDDFTVTEKDGKKYKINYDQVESLRGKNLTTGTWVAIGILAGAGAFLLLFWRAYCNGEGC